MILCNMNKYLFVCIAVSMFNIRQRIYVFYSAKVHNV